MSEFIFDLQRFESRGSESKTDKVPTKIPGVNDADTWVIYSSKEINTFINEAAALRGIVAPDEYAATVYGDNISVDGYNNNIIYNADRFDAINFNNLRLSSLAYFAEGDGYYDLVFSTGAITRIYSTDTEFTPTFNFGSGLSEIYSPAVDSWFTPQEIQYATQYWSDLAYHVGTDNFYDTALVSRGINNLVTNVESTDSIYLYDSSFVGGNIIYTEANEGNIHFLFDNGTSTIIRYDGTFSPTIYTTDLDGFVYNSRMGEWRTPAQALTDAAQYAAEDELAAAEQAAFEANFNKVLNADDYTTPINVSRFESTLIYDGDSDNDLYFYDTTRGNILDIGVEGDSYLNVIFDTGALARINYDSIVSPIFHLADGENFAYNWATGEFCDAYSGSIYYDEESGASYYSTNDVFTISRNNNSFVNDVTASDDIYLYDTTAANLTGINTIGVYALSLDFDTGTNLRVQDGSNVSPVFHFGDGTAMAYNWINDEWAGAYETTAGVADSVVVSSVTNNFIRNTETVDNVIIADATTANIVGIHIDDDYINLRFDTGASTAIKYANAVSSAFTFADGSQYYYNLNVGEWQTPAQYATYLSSSADLWGDTPDTADGLFADNAFASGATLSDLVSAPVDNAAISFNTDGAFDINSAGGFVAANTAVSSEQQDA